ncbi:hypothetical protein OQ790_11695 [Mycobacterium ulcerans]|nr:hypothetical protein [Mycobacterium ulcerans]MEB3905026.1 hypothetical protein [Mycobacterium ulcerans]MEB3909262.1 hypothetical protein [Mycobacterium ulcerans]MEB3946246.1 hypothetical protein [Mycobacterium ulcerans]MEB3956456.1 hypothetical protein [Mycobacterium ulcerans]MEB3973377.1 hypothetical protein [Mycobacterium ulcerans]
MTAEMAGPAGPVVPVGWRRRLDTSTAVMVPAVPAVPAGRQATPETAATVPMPPLPVARAEPAATAVTQALEAVAASAATAAMAPTPPTVHLRAHTEPEVTVVLAATALTPPLRVRPAAPAVTAGWSAMVVLAVTVVMARPALTAPRP